MEPSGRKCHGCQRPLDEGVRFCVACGTHNYDPESGDVLSATSQMKTHRKRKVMERIAYWWKVWVTGISR